MPLYEYYCPRCGEHFEKLVPFTASNSCMECPACGSSDAQKQLSRIARQSFAEGKGNTSTSSSCSSTSGFR